ncbi:MAG: RsmB/NOP family class I SAM-dependent RNA methyltransferase, partial [Deltaproteobacteria bacterium]|nr:RsmB/NOP family class I SAM-dependent RNA methyltransferase [Deltaproteobacteria bacterium]
MVDDVSLNTLRRFTPILAAGEEAALLAACDQGLPVCIAANTLRCTPTALHERLLAQGVRLDPLSWHPAAFRWPEDAPTPGKFLEFVAGLYWVQEEAAMLPVRLLDPRPGERILDLCAAPGNKTAQIALALEGRGVLVANDRVPSRMRSLGATLDRLGPLVVSRTMLDGRRFPTQAEPFDRVLVDAPCTCLGTSRKSRRILRRWTQR